MSEEMIAEEGVKPAEAALQTAKKKTARKAKKTTSKKIATQKKAPQDVPSPEEQLNNQLVLNLSKSLSKKLTELAKAEGLSTDELAEELLSESLVLRAWDVLERRMAMRANTMVQGGSHTHGQRNHGRNNHRNHNRHGNSFNKGGGGKNFQQRRGNFKGGFGNSVDESASFREFLREQEKQHRQ